MKQFRLDGRTAIVTGAGGNPGLGRAHALLLASRGANVVVNDIGRDPDVPGYFEAASAEAVAEEIRAAGGKAVADDHSVASEDGVAAIVESALAAFGGVDILVNNAGVIIHATFDAITAADIRKQIDVNLMGTILMCRAVWPHMQALRYGRIVNIASGSMAGFSWQTAYCASKGGVFSFTRSLAAEGAAHGIKVNAVNPGAFTRMVTSQLEETSAVYQNARENYPPEVVSPAVVFLAHEDCPVSGECIESVGGTVRRVYLAHTAGFVDPALTIEAVAERWDEIIGGADASIIGQEVLDPALWQFRPYRPASTG